MKNEIRGSKYIAELGVDDRNQLRTPRILGQFVGRHEGAASMAEDKNAFLSAEWPLIYTHEAHAAYNIKHQSMAVFAGFLPRPS